MTTSNTAEQKSVIGKKELRSIFYVHYLWNTLGIMRDNRIWDIVLQCFLRLKRFIRKRRPDSSSKTPHGIF